MMLISVSLPLNNNTGRLPAGRAASRRLAGLASLLGVLPLCAQTAAPAGDPIAEPLVKSIAEISAKDFPTARDYARIADATVDFGRRKTQAGEPLNRNVIESGLDAVDAGERENPKAADWPRLRKELNAFLQDQEKNEQQPQQQPQQPQDQNPGQDKQDSPQDSSGSQKNADDASQKGEKGESSSKPDERSSPGEKEPQGGDSQEDPARKPPSNPASAFGDMKGDTPQPTPPPENAPPSASDTQKVGGQEKREGGRAQADPGLVVPLQKLDQLKQQDSPAKLFKLMEGPRESTPAKKGKDW